MPGAARARSFAPASVREARVHGSGGENNNSLRFADVCCATKRTSELTQPMSAFGGKADIIRTQRNVRTCKSQKLLLGKMIVEGHSAGRNFLL